MYFDIYYFILIIPAMLFTFYAQSKVSSAFKKYSQVGNRNNLTGVQVAQKLLQMSGINDVSVERISGSLTDHYDPKAKVIRLSDVVYGSNSLAAVGVAAHETGHAVQHNKGYAPLLIRNSIVPVVSLCSGMAMPIASVGIMILAMSSRGTFGYILVELGIVLFLGVVIFHLITLPVELNASNRAIDMLSESRLLSEGEIVPARKVLNAAAMTYIASAAVAVANLLRLIMIVAGRRNRR